MTHPLTIHGDEPLGGPARPPLLYNLVYCSRAAAGVGEADVDAILHTARRWNPEHGITGLLVFGGGIFFQWLEGPRDNLLRLLAALRTDARHHDIVLLTETEEPRERLFPDWAMERVAAEDVRDVLQDAHDTARDPANARALADMLAQLDGGALGGAAHAAG
jgi:hypothetical protein